MEWAAATVGHGGACGRDGGRPSVPTVLLPTPLACHTRSFTFPLYFGRIGLLPFGVPLDVVVGAPLALPKWEGERWLGGGKGRRHAHSWVWICS